MVLQYVTSSSWNLASFLPLLLTRAKDGFHSSHDDATEHATLRLFEDVEWNPWNGRTFHLYRDGTSKFWRHDKWEAEERPAAPN